MSFQQPSAIHLRDDLPTFKAGDTVAIQSKIKEGNRERVQTFEGVVIRRNGSGISSTFTVRRVTMGVGVERVFPLHSPQIVGIKVKTEGFVRRSKLHYLRELDGRAARIQDRKLKLMEAQGASQSKKDGAKKS